MQATVDLDQAFRTAEIDSIRLAAKGRLLVIAIFGAYAVFGLSGALMLNTLLHLGAFAVLAAALLFSARATRDRPWIKYVVVALEVVILAEAVLTPNPFNPEPWPDAMVFRYDNFYYFFAVIAVSVFSLSPYLVAWAGLCTAVAWGVGVILILSGPQSVPFSDVVAEAENSREVLGFYVEPNVVVISGRVKEIVTALVVSLLLAIVVWRGRRAVVERLTAEQDRRLLTELFGRYVPQQVAEAIVADRGTLAPEERHATVLFADIEGFTSTVEQMAPGDALRMLNEYFSAANAIMGRHGGVITQFQGDAILTSFNVPVPSPDHAGEALRAAAELLDEVERREFGGQRLRVRIGVNTGPVVAGTVGGTGRQHYTVHGDAVNLAARLEQLNKDTGTRLLVSESTLELQGGAGAAWTRVGEQALRGRSRPIAIYTPRGGALDEAASDAVA